MVGASSTGHQTGSGVLNRLQPVHQSFRDAEEQRVVVVQAKKRRRTPGLMSYSHLHLATGQRQPAVAGGGAVCLLCATNCCKYASTLASFLHSNSLN